MENLKKSSSNTHFDQAYVDFMADTIWATSQENPASGFPTIPSPCCVLEQRHIYSPKSTGNTQKAMAPSRFDWKIVDWDVKHQRKQTKPGPTQLRQYKYRRCLEAWKNRGIVLYMLGKTKALISCSVTVQLICAFCFCICRSSHDTAHMLTVKLMGV